MGISLAEIAPNHEIDLRVISTRGESSGSYVLDKLDTRSLKLTSKAPGRLNYYVATARGTLNFDDLSNPIDVVLGADGEHCNGMLSYENDALVVRLKEDPDIKIKIAIFNFNAKAKIREMTLVRRGTKEIVFKSAMPDIALTVCPLNKLDDLVYETSRGPIRVEIAEKYSRELPDFYMGLFFEELGAIILIID